MLCNFNICICVRNYLIFSSLQTFTLTTICACPGGCDEHGPISGGGGGGKSGSGGSDKAGIPGIVILSVYVNNQSCCTPSPNVMSILIIHIRRYSYFSDTLILAILCRQGFSIFLF